ncbi:MAG: hypothetical protein WC243_01490 [Patescibacteria group bacterium]
METVQAPEVVKLVAKETVAFVLEKVTGDEKVPELLEKVLSTDPLKTIGRLAPPKAPPDWEKLPDTLMVIEEPGLEIVPLERVKSPVLNP